MKHPVAFLWHMHQPDYRDAYSGEFLLPWVRLHATHSYLDMLHLALEYPECAHMINFSPVLLDQLEEYAAGSTNDVFEKLAQVPSKDLSVKQREFIHKCFFYANPPSQIMPFPRYKALWEKLQTEGADAFTDRDTGDLQVWHSLAWMGWKARERGDVKELIAKGRGFSNRDRESILEIQRQIIAEVLSLIPRVAAESTSELTCSPYYHPILPLLCDNYEARGSMPHAPMPQSRFMRRDEAEWHVKEGLNRLAKLTGVKPRGMWPSEGAVSREALDVIAAEGVEWIVTDEEICWKSHPAPQSNRDIRMAHRLNSNSGSPIIFFRDKGLSDTIGFQYQSMDAADAVSDFVRRLQDAAGSDDADGVIVVAVDGENPWSYYEHAGKGFQTGLAKALPRHPSLTTTTLSQFLGRSAQVRAIDKLHSGSWIYADFHYWIGDEFKNEAWERLDDAAQLTRAHEKSTDEHSLKLAREYLRKAEGSDWYWWFGEPNRSESEHIFDRLFRRNLKRVREIIGGVSA